MEQTQVKAAEGASSNNHPYIGSQWRIWDLHVHPPQIDTGDYDTFISNLAASPAAVIGINDYFSLEGYKEVVKRGGVKNKVLFPVIEFRMHNIIENKHNKGKDTPAGKRGERINFHVIFNNDPSLLESISLWLASLKCHEGSNTVQLGAVKDKEKITVQFENVLDELQKLLPDQYLIWLPYDEYGGVDEIDPEDGFFKQALVAKAHIFGSGRPKQIAFFKWADPKYSKENYSQWLGKPKPCIKGSDAHTLNYPFGHLMNDKSEPIDRFCWIKADTTFIGLKQILHEPDRVYIGQEPNVLKRVRSSPTKFISNLSIKKIAPTTPDDVWFEDFSIDLNSSLVAIIGNKGNGKSAITDVISLCGNTTQPPNNFSFLTNQKFRKPKPFNLADRFEGCITWHDGSRLPKKLSDNPELTSPERVKYIPQNFLEVLCANIDSKAFEQQLKQIIFSHTPMEKRLSASSLDELIEYHSNLLNDEIAKHKVEVTEANHAIVALEEKATEAYKIAVNNKLQLKNEELAAHLKIKPEEPAKVEHNEKTQALVDSLNKLRESIQQVENEVKALRAKLTELSLRSANLKKARQFYANLTIQLKKYQSEQDEHVAVLRINDISPLTVFNFSIDTVPIDTVVSRLDNEIDGINVLLSLGNPLGPVSKLGVLQGQLKAGQEELDRPARLHQKFLDDMKEWDEKRQLIEGSDSVDESLKYYEGQVNYLNEELQPALANKYKERKEMTAKLIEKKFELLRLRKELFQPVMDFISQLEDLKARYDVKFDASLELNAFPDEFIGFISQNRIGSFAGKEEGYKRILELVERSNFTSISGFFEFIDEIEKHLKADYRSKDRPVVEMSTQLRTNKSIEQLYDFLYHADFLQPIYNLKLGTKSLQELSPGERGALLLIFYLVLDNDDVPLIIDQPEENLDNETVYHVLVHFIKAVKEKRQIIIVTHNPNLAVVCDADQIINMRIDKENKNKVIAHSGSIENPEINKRIIDILEGTLPAFNNRDSKYTR